MILSCGPFQLPFSKAEGVSLDSSIVYDGDSIGGCYVPTKFENNNAQVFSLFGDPSIVGSIVMHLVRHEVSGCLMFCVTYMRA